MVEIKHHIIMYFCVLIVRACFIACNYVYFSQRVVDVWNSLSNDIISAASTKRVISNLINAHYLCVCFGITCIFSFIYTLYIYRFIYTVLFPIDAHYLIDAHTP